MGTVRPTLLPQLALKKMAIFRGKGTGQDV